MDFEDDQSYHKHCASCFKTICIDPFEKTCPVVSCTYGCGLMLHRCKMKDHSNICYSFIQPCINSLYGCPYNLRRSQVRDHLSTCPASTLVCTMEWNRQPLHLTDSITMKNYNPNNPVYSQLEVALALKDQRVLLEAMIPHGILEKIVKNSENPQQIICPFMTTKVKHVEEERTSQDSTNDASTKKETDIGNTYKKPSKDISIDDSKPSPVHNQSNLHQDIVPRKPLLRSKFRLAPKKEFAEASCGTSDLEIDTCNMNWMNPGLKVLGKDKITCIFEMMGAYEKRETISNSQRGDGMRCTLNDVRLCSFRHVATQTRPFFDMNKHVGKIGGALQETFSETGYDTCVLSSFHNPSLYETLALNQVIGCLPRYERKSRSVYSFMCNNLFRRDHFPSHFQSVHNEIYSNLDGWLEEKCPYSQYGCTFSQLRLTPNCHKSQLVYDNRRSCFTVKVSDISQPTTTELRDENVINILNLPWELQKRIVDYLDSYSIGQLAQTCTYFKHLCVFHLKEHGIVSLKWEKFELKDASICWRSTGETWLFGNSFSPVRKWLFSKVPSMSQHISNCSFASNATVKYPEATRIKLLSTNRRKKESLHENGLNVDIPDISEKNDVKNYSVETSLTKTSN